MNNEAPHLVQVAEQTRDNTESILHSLMNIDYADLYRPPRTRTL